MTEQEAEKVAAVLATADSGCPDCVRNLVEKIQEVFPEFNWAELAEKHNYWRE